MSHEKPLSSQERYKLKQLEFKEENKKALCITNLICTVVTVGLVIGTLVILSTETNLIDSTSNSCTDSHLRLTLWLMIGMHCTNIIESVCGLTGLDKIFCGCICTLSFFFYEVGVLIYMQTVYYSQSYCADETPKQYYWLLVNIIVYFGFVAVACYFHLRSLFGSPTQKQVEEEALNRSY